MRTIGVVTGARSDYGIYYPVLREIVSHADLRLHLIVTGSHLSPRFGETVQAIEKDGFKISDKVEMLLCSDSAEGIAKSMGLGVLGLAQAYGRTRPDILLVLGDRYEMLAAAAAAAPFLIPVAHLHGGELSEGAVDECFRHAITKMSHLHFPSMDVYARRILQMGEESWRVKVVGAPALDRLRNLPIQSREDVAREAGLCLPECYLLATYHPESLAFEQTESRMRELLAALEELDMSVVFTYPGADASSQVIIRMIEEFRKTHTGVQVAASLGSEMYFKVMSHAAAMIGNSSSGIIEAASFKLPVVNIGSRQQGRCRAKNVVDTGCTRMEIVDAVRTVVSTGFRDSLADLVNPYGDGQAAPRIVEVLGSVPLDQRLLMKRFVDRNDCIRTNGDS